MKEHKRYTQIETFHAISEISARKYFPTYRIVVMKSSSRDRTESEIGDLEEPESDNREN